MKPRVANYFRSGFTMSRRAYISHKQDEHPITHWIKILALDKETIKNMLVHVGMHHTGMYAQRTQFYRMPRLNPYNERYEKEMTRFFKTFQTIPATKRKCINYMAEYLQQKIRGPVIVSDKGQSNNKYIKLNQLFSDEKI